MYILFIICIFYNKIECWRIFSLSTYELVCVAKKMFSQSNNIQFILNETVYTDINILQTLLDISLPYTRHITLSTHQLQYFFYGEDKK